MVDDLILGYHILADQAHEFLRLGHLSVRADDGESLRIRRSDASMAEVDGDKLMRVDFAGSVIDGTGNPHVEVPIHAEIYRRRSDVGAVVHTHALEVAALAASSGQFRMVSQQSIYFAGGVAHYGSSELVTTRERGRALAEALGDKRAVVLRNHGLVTVGATVREAVVLAVNFVASLRVQLAAARLGEIADITKSDVARMSADVENSYPRLIERFWRVLCDDLPVGTA